VRYTLITEFRMVLKVRKCMLYINLWHLLGPLLVARWIFLWSFTFSAGFCNLHINLADLDVSWKIFV